MKVKITNRKLVEHINLIGQVSQKQLPAKVSYTIAWNTQHIDSTLKPYNDTKKELLEKYVEQDKNGLPALTEDRLDLKYKDDESRKKFKAEHDDILDIENEVEIRKIKLKDIENVNFSAAEFRAVDFMIEE